MSSLALERVCVAYDAKTVVSDATVHVPGGGWLGLVGPNGAGKSSLLKAVAGLVASTGDVRYGDVSVSTLGRRALARIVAYVPQRPEVPQGMSVTDYVLLGRTPHISYLGSESRRDIETAEQTIERLQLHDLASRQLGSLSGGEVQRTILARALAQQAPLLLLDEPTSALDIGHQQQALELVDALRAEHGLTVVSAMHDLTLAGQFSDELLLLDGGRVAALGPARTVLTEEIIREHYGAVVQVIHDPSGGVLVVPTRARRAYEASLEETRWA